MEVLESYNDRHLHTTTSKLSDKHLDFDEHEILDALDTNSEPQYQIFINYIYLIHIYFS